MLIIIGIAAMAGCATPSVTQTMKPGDEELTCARLKNEYSKANRVIGEAQQEKGFTGGNIARGLFFCPAILGTYSNANEAIAAAATRKVNLMNITRTKKCEGMDRLSYVFRETRVL